MGHLEYHYVLSLLWIRVCLDLALKRVMAEAVGDPEVNTYILEYVPEVRFGVKITGGNLMDKPIYDTDFSPPATAVMFLLTIHPTALEAGDFLSTGVKR